MNPRYIESLSWRFAEVYEACVNQILINMARHFPYLKAGQHVGSWDYQVRKLAEMGQVNKETVEIMMQMLGGADEALRADLQAAIMDGLKDAEPALRKAAQAGMLNGGTVPKLSLDQMQAFASYYRQSADGLNLVNTVMLESTQAAYAATVADIASRIDKAQGVLNIATGEVIAGTESINQAIRQGVKNMVDIGLTGFIDHGGHHWTPEAYVAMDVRTTMANAAREAVFERNDDYGNDLYQVSWHNGARPLCYPWQGKVISKIDWIRDAEDDEGNPVQVYAQSDTTYGEPAGLFGINCGHYPIPFVSGFSRIRSPKQDEQENDKEYEESQQQRKLERQLRDEKRDLEVMKAQGASKEEIAFQKDRIKQASNDLDQFCYETGRARRTSREGSPVRAVWDTPDGPVARFDGGYISAGATPPRKNPAKPLTAPVTYGNVLDGIPTQKYRTGVIQRIKNAPENGRKAWQKCQAKFKEPSWSASADSAAYYSPWENRCHFRGETKAFEASNYQEEYAVWFHEYGHNIDALYGDISLANDNAFGESLYEECRKRVVEYFNQIYDLDSFDLTWQAQTGQGGMGFRNYIRYELRNTLPRDEWAWMREMLPDENASRRVWREFYEENLKDMQVFKDYGEKLLSDRLRDSSVRDGFIAYVNDNYTLKQRTDVSDMFCEFAIDTWGRKYNYPFGVGHEYNYWKNPYLEEHRSLAVEAFAEMYSATMTNNSSLPVIKEFFPESYKLFLEMLEDIATHDI